MTSADKKYTFQETKINLISYISCSLNEKFNFAFCNGIDCFKMYIKYNSDLKSLSKIVTRLSLQTYWVNFDCSKDFLLKSNWVWCVQSYKNFFTENSKEGLCNTCKCTTVINIFSHTFSLSTNMEILNSKKCFMVSELATLSVCHSNWPKKLDTSKPH